MSKDSNEDIYELLGRVNSYISGYINKKQLQKEINLYHGKSLQLLLSNIKHQLLHTRMTTIQKTRASEVIIIINKVPTFRTRKYRRRGSSNRSTGGIGRKNRKYFLSRKTRNR